MKELKTFGLTDNEIEVYITVLKQGSSTIKSITKLCSVKRTTLYSCLTKLISLGLVTEGKRNKKKQFVAENPDRLLDSVNQQKKILKKLIPKLKTIAKKSPAIPDVRLYQGKTAYWNMTDDILKEKKDCYIIVSAIKHFQIIKMKEFEKRVSRRRRQIGKAKFYYIIDKEESVIRDYFRDEKDFAEYRFLPDNHPVNGGLGVYGNKVIFFSPEDPMWGMIVENQEIAKIIKYMWDTIWEELENKNLPVK